ncbi:helix-turn-helix domain-containing protein [Carboxylicivirga sp. RSCT41]|uniref:helix-turn-helix domain-containing protein n=1 Tax=Carboxylicivirga agarovorans TaxID=3417570 RepID=UPI003D32D388
MTSSIRIKRVCEYCGKEFNAKTTVTRYCSKTCNSAALKRKYRQAKIDISNEKTQTIKTQNQDYLTALKNKDVFTISDAALFLSVSRQTVYNWLNNGILNGKRISNRKVLFLKNDILAFLESKTAYAKPISNNKPITDFYTIKEVQEKYGIANTYTYRIIKEHKIPKTYHLGKTLVSKEHIDNFFKKKDRNLNNIIEWYSVQEIMDKFGLSRDQVYNQLSANAVPRKRVGKFVQISKKHFDDIHYIKI